MKGSLCPACHKAKPPKKSKPETAEGGAIRYPGGKNKPEHDKTFPLLALTPETVVQNPPAVGEWDWAEDQLAAIRIDPPDPGDPEKSENLYFSQFTQLTDLSTFYNQSLGYIRWKQGKILFYLRKITPHGQWAKTVKKLKGWKPALEQRCRKIALQFDEKEAMQMGYMEMLALLYPSYATTEDETEQADKDEYLKEEELRAKEKLTLKLPTANPATMTMNDHDDIKPIGNYVDNVEKAAIALEKRLEQKDELGGLESEATKDKSLALKLYQAMAIIRKARTALLDRARDNNLKAADQVTKEIEYANSETEEVLPC